MPLLTKRNEARLGGYSISWSVCGLILGGGKEERSSLHGVSRECLQQEVLIVGAVFLCSGDKSCSCEGQQSEQRARRPEWSWQSHVLGEAAEKFAGRGE